MGHIMEVLPKFRVLGISYTSQDARMVTLDSIQITPSDGNA